MNNRFEFDSEAFGDQPISFEGEEEIRRRGAGRSPQRKPAAGRKTGASRKAASGRKPAPKPRPRPGKKFPIRVPVAAFPLPVWPPLSPEPAKEPRGQEPPQNSGPSGSPPPESDQARDGGEYTRWAQITLNNALNLNLQTSGVMDDATREAIRNFQQREGLPVTGAIGPDTEQALIAAGKKSAPAMEEPPSNDAGPSEDAGTEQELWMGPWRRRRLKRSAGHAAPEQGSWFGNEAEGAFGDPTASG